MFGDFEDDDRLWTPRQFLTNVGGALALWAAVVGIVYGTIACCNWLFGV